MKVIFLDIDGVLNTVNTRIECGMDNIDPGRLALLHALVTDTGAEVVLSSAWRTFHTIEEMNAMLGLRLAGETLEDPEDRRGAEIAEWVRTAGVDKFVILDDRDDMYPHMDRLIRTNDRTGLTAKHCKRAKELLA
jgi:hypothetical protein